jgi:hypothetical protein
MRHTKYPELKAELKELAKEIRQLKYKRDHYWEFGNDQSEFMWNAKKKGWDFRHLHIAYCMLRGREYGEIENYCREAPDFKRIDRIRGEHAEQTLRACA